MLCKVAGYLFDLSVSSKVAPELANRLHAALRVVLQGFAQTEVPTHNQTQHEVFVYEYEAGLLRSVSGPAINHISIELYDAALHHHFSKLLVRFEASIISLAVRESPPSLWIHGACLYRDEELILLIAESGTGKTTLSLGLTMRGYRLLTDDIIIMDMESCHYQPLPRSPKLRGDAIENLARVGFVPEDGARVDPYIILPNNLWQSDPVPGPPDRVYFLQRRADLEPGLKPLSLTDSLINLLPHSNFIPVDPDLTFTSKFLESTRFYNLNLSNLANDIDCVAQP